jgi:hypothetical protein
MTISDCANLLRLVHRRHKISYTNVTEQRNEDEVLVTIGLAKGICNEGWPSDLEVHRPLVGRVINHYEQLVVNGFENKRGELWGKEKFTGHLWAMQKAQRHETGMRDD